jgi:O-antigen/teichoic acid export membrane protein
MALRATLIYNIVASFGSIFWRIIIQLLLPPVLLVIWGPARYGEWLLITSIPMFLAIADFGFTDAASADMTMEIARDNREQTIVIFQSVLVMASVVVAALCLLFSVILIPSDLTIGQIHFTKEDLNVAYLFVIYSAGLIVSRVFLGTLKAGGAYAPSTLMYDAIQFLEGLSLLAAAYFGASFATCALLYLLLRAVNIIALIIMQKRRMPWLKFGLRRADLREIKRLSLPAVAAMAIPLALAINFQGVVWMAGSILGPSASAIVATVRTAARVIIQLIGIFSRAAMPLYSASIATGNSRQTSIIQKVNRYLTVVLLIPGCIAFAVFGHQLISIWTHGRIDAPETFIILIAAANVMHGAWFFNSNLLLAINRHTGFAGVLVGLTISFFLVGLLLTHQLGLNGTGLSVLGLETATLLGMMLQARGRPREIGAT